MAGNQTKSESTLIKKVGDIANVMAAAGVGFTDYITQLTYILFLKMDEEKEEMGLSSSIPDGYKFSVCRQAFSMHRALKQMSFSLKKENLPKIYGCMITVPA